MISVIIPTLNAEPHAETLMRSLYEQTLAPVETIVIDSKSDDDTASAFRKLGARAEVIERHQFHHAEVRNRGARIARGDILVFMTQDARPLEPQCLEQLVAKLLDGQVAASFARQVPGAAASPLERHARAANYPPESRVISIEDAGRLGARTFFFSNSFSAIDRRIFDRLGGFPVHTVMNEDMLFAARLLRTGHRIAYVAEAKVEHHHDYTLRQTFRRYFDIGAVFDQASEELAELPLAADGMQYVGKLLTRLVRERDYHWIPVALAESAAKFAGLQLGRQHRKIPLPWIKRLSMHPNYWPSRR